MWHHHIIYLQSTEKRKYVIVSRKQKLYKIYAKIVEVTHTLYDPEVENKKILPVNKRKSLLK